jgi:hypothetical protein
MLSTSEVNQKKFTALRRRLALLLYENCSVVAVTSGHIIGMMRFKEYLQNIPPENRVATVDKL